MAFKLAELLLRRKELNGKPALMQTINNRDMFEPRVKRVNVTEGVDEVIANVPKMTFGQFNAERDYYARQLRLCDALIQRANWDTEVETNEPLMTDYVPPATA